VAEATSRDECIDRHRGYVIDIGTRLNALQRARISRMVQEVCPGDRVLDVGCNTGYIVEFLHPECVAYGVDVAAELLPWAARRLHEVREAPAEDLPYPAASMDVVLLGEILEHVHDPVSVVREAARVSRRVVAGSTPHERGKWGPGGTKPPGSHRFHVRCFTASTLRAALEEGGLRDVVVSAVSRKGTPQMYVFRGTP
jgi:SAM-dependent methyltransferase